MEDAIRVAALNIGGLAGQDPDLSQMMRRHSLDFLFISETWARVDSLSPRNENIIYWGPWTDRSTTGHTHYGVALFVGDQINKRDVKVEAGVRGHSVWWTYQGIRFGGMYLAPSRSSEQVLATLADPAGEKNDPMVLIGDFNMRIGNASGDAIWCQRAVEMYPWLMDRGFTHIPTEWGMATNVRQRDGHAEERSIVDLVFSQLGEDRHTRTSVIHDLALGKSDHRLICTEILLAQPRPAVVPTCLELNVVRLKSKRVMYDAAARRAVNPALADWERRLRACSSPDDAKRMVTDVEAEMRDAILLAAHEVVGTRQKPTTGRQLLRHEGFRVAKADLRKAFARHSHWPTDETAAALKAARQWHTIMLHQAREEAFIQFTERIDKMEDHEVSKIIAAHYRRLVRCKAHLAADPASLNRYAQHFGRAWAWNAEIHDPVVARDVIDQTRGSGDPFPMGPQEIWDTMQKMPKAKTPGPTRFRNELLVFAPLAVANAAHALFSCCWRWGVVPETWTTALIHPVPKKGDLSRIENYRPISLTETFRKLFEKCLQPALTGMIEPLDIAQGGFREKRSTLEDVVALQEAIVQTKAATKRYPLVAYLDIKAAYDTVHRRRLWHLLHERGTSMRMIATLRALFDGNTSKVGISGATSEMIEQPMGLLQGSILSPILYAGFIDGLAGRIRQVSNVTLGAHRLGGFFYADDIAIVAKNADDLQRILQECEAHSLENGYRFSPTKCEIVAEEEVDTSNCGLYGQRLVRSQQFVYLGVTMDVRGIAKEAHVMRLAAKANSSIAIARTVGMNGSGFSTRVKKRIYETFIRPKFEYGLAIIPPSAKMMALLERVQYRALCAMMSVSPTTGSNALHALTGVQSMRQRWIELSASFWRRTTRLGNQFMVYHARSAHARRDVKTSVFHDEVKRNSMVRRYTAATFGQPHMEDDESIALMKEMRKKDRFNDRCQLWIDPARKHQVELIEFRRYRTARWVDGLLGRQGRRVVYLWILRRLIGKPRPCLNCLCALGTNQHVQQCTGLNVDLMIKRRQYVLAAELIADICRQCLGRPMGKLRTELRMAQEHEAVNTRRTLREDHQDGVVDADGEELPQLPPAEPP